MKTYEVLENCHYKDVTFRKGQKVRLPEDPKWPEVFKAMPDERPQASQTVPPEAGAVAPSSDAGGAQAALPPEHGSRQGTEKEPQAKTRK